MTADAALDYARRGLAVFPVSADKRPLVKRGLHAASTDPETVASWWQRHPDALIGLATGQVNGLVVIDVDPRNGGTASPDWPDTRTARTRSGGTHLYYRSNEPLPCSAGRLAEGVDVRGDGGYVIAPPSPGWEWTDANVEIIELPASLADQLVRDADPAPAVGGTIPKGRQHATLVSIAGSMRRRGLDAAEIDAALQVVNATRCEVPGPPENIRRIAESVAQYEPDQPIPTIATQQHSDTEAQPRTIGRTAAELLEEEPEEIDWLIPGVMGKGWMVKFAAREKTGKGTLILYLLGCLERGESTVFGPAAAEKHTALIYTEEPIDSMREKLAAFGLRRAVVVFGWELSHLPDWPAKVKCLTDVVTREGLDIAFIDNISRAAAVQEEAGTELARVAEHLGEAMRAVGASVAMDHHFRKGAGPLADKSRGGTALAGATDNNIELEHVGDWDSRVRRVSARGRVSATIWSKQIALADDGTSYELVADSDQPQRAPERHRLRALQEADTPEGLTAAEFAELIDVQPRRARDVLNEFVRDGRATVVGDKTPRRYRAVNEADEVPI